jgi:hypothetical protein
VVTVGPVHVDDSARLSRCGCAASISR